LQGAISFDKKRGSRFQRAILKLRSDLDKKQSADGSVRAANGALQF